MATEKSLIVFDHGWYSELPDDVCEKVPLLDSEGLYESMLVLAREPELRWRLGKNSLIKAKQRHAALKVVAEYIDYLTISQADIDRRR